MNDGFQVSCMAAMPQMGMEPRQWLAALFGMGWSNGFLDDCGWYIYSISMVYLWYIMLHQKKHPHVETWSSVALLCRAYHISFHLLGLVHAWPVCHCMQMSMGKMRMNNDILVGALLIFQTNSLEDMFCFTRVRGCFRTCSCGYGYGSTH